MKLNEYQSAEAGIQGNDRPIYDYLKIKDALGNYYDAEITKEYLTEYEEEIPYTDRSTEEFYINSFKEWNRKSQKLTPPFEDDIINTRDFNRKYGEQMSEDASVAVQGMGAVVTATPSSVPGQTVGGDGTVGSGDIGSGWANSNISPRPITSRRKKKILGALKKFNKQSKTDNTYNSKIYKDAGKAKSFIMPFSDFVKKNKK